MILVFQGYRSGPVTVPRSSANAKNRRTLMSEAAPGVSIKFTQHRRLDKLRDVLARHPRGVTLYELAELLQVTPRTMRRYLKEIEREFELSPVRPRGGGPSLWRIRPSELPRKVEMRRAQAYSLLATRRVFEPFRGSALYDEIDLAVAKLMAFAERPGRGPNAGRANTALADRFLYVPTRHKDYSDKTEAIDELFQAVLELRPLTLKHRAKGASREERVTLNPCGLVLHGDQVYCVGQRPEAEGFETYALDQMRDVRTIADRHFPLPKDFSLEDQFRGELGAGVAATSTVVVVDLQPSLAKSLRTLRLHRSQKITSLPGGRGRLTLNLEDPLSLCGKVLCWGSAAYVREPESLRNEVKKELQAALAAYVDEP